jgi:hypothetical protein
MQNLRQPSQGKDFFKGTVMIISLLLFVKMCGDCGKPDTSVDSTQVTSTPTYTPPTYQTNTGEETKKNEPATTGKYEHRLVEAKMDEMMKHFEENCLTGFTGYYYPLERYVKNMLDDPDSYEYVKEFYYIEDAMQYVEVTLTYRCKNAFGGKVTNTITGKVGRNCEFLGILTR